MDETVSSLRAKSCHSHYLQIFTFGTSLTQQPNQFFSFTSNVDLISFHAYIDILQTSSLVPQNLIALKTDPSQTCHFSAPSAGSTQPIDNQLGTSASSNCSDGTIGCEVQGLQGDVGDGLNVGGGGIYAMAWEYDSIRIWRFFRKDVPKELNDTNTSVLDVERWDTPIANFWYNSTDDNCDILGIFRNQALVRLFRFLLIGFSS
jgi:hypothetical protein